MAVRPHHYALLWFPVLCFAATLGCAARTANQAPGSLPVRAERVPTVSAVDGGEPSTSWLPAEAAIAMRAAELVGAQSLRGRGVPDDCTGLVRLAVEPADVSLFDSEAAAFKNAVTAIYDRALRQGAVHFGPPHPGDIVFFAETYDQNRDGMRNDGLTHVAIVEAVNEAGTIVYIHRGGRGVARARMTQSQPQARLGASGEVLNDYLRPASRGEDAYLAGELFAGFACPALMR